MSLISPRHVKIQEPGAQDSHGIEKSRRKPARNVKKQSSRTTKPDPHLAQNLIRIEGRSSA